MAGGSGRELRAREFGRSSVTSRWLSFCPFAPERISRGPAQTASADDTSFGPLPDAPVPLRCRAK